MIELQLRQRGCQCFKMSLPQSYIWNALENKIKKGQLTTKTRKIEQLSEAIISENYFKKY